MGMDPNDGTVLVVDDEPMVADTFSLQLERRFTVRTAYGGEEALSIVDDVDVDVDVILLDRRMPDVTGDEVLHELRDREDDVRVVMVTAVDADVDIISMPCDGYLEKPVNGEELRDAVERQLTVRRYDRRISEFFATTDKLATLEAERPTEVLESHEEYVDLKEHHEALREELETLFEAVDHDVLLSERGVSF